MKIAPPHAEPHRLNRSGWLRAAVLGANDGIVSTASLIVGVVAASASRDAVLIAGFAGLVAGAMSMAAGEYVSVSAQADLERADIGNEKRALKTMPAEELAELAAIYRARGLDPDLAQRVAEQLTAHDALEAHKRDELGLTEAAAARPLQAAFSSALSFAGGAVLPLAAAAMAPHGLIFPAVIAASLVALALLGAASARAGGAGVLRSVARILLWGVAAMSATAAAGRLFGAAG